MSAQLIKGRPSRLCLLPHRPAEISSAHANHPVPLYVCVSGGCTAEVWGLAWIRHARPSEALVIAALEGLFDWGLVCSIASMQVIGSAATLAGSAGLACLAARLEQEAFNCVLQKGGGLTTAAVRRFTACSHLPVRPWVIGVSGPAGGRAGACAHVYAREQVRCIAS